jgi:uncharacterized protein YndB with AHSA1/START domain
VTSTARLDGDQLIATRYVDAEPALVWEAFTTPQHLAAFWGGNHAAVRPDSVAIDLRVGGTFEIETLGADGSRHPLRFQYEIVDAPTRLVLTEPRTGITTDIRLEPSSGGTNVVVHQQRVPPELQTEAARTGLAGILERLDHILGELTNDRQGGDT